MAIRAVGLSLSVAAFVASLVGPRAAFATSWTVTLHVSSAAEAHAQSPPAAPTGVSDSCVSSSQQKVTVVWGAVAHASSYTIDYSTTSATSGYALEVSGQTGTSWTSGTLAAANYWFEVLVYVGTHWVSANSSATGETTVNTSGTKCTQP
jgi:hypothetical protein